RVEGVGGEARQVPTHLLDLAMDERALRVARPFHEPIRIGGADPGQLPGEVEVAAGIAFLRDDAHAVLPAGVDEGVESTFAEIVVDVETPEALELPQLLIDEVDQVAEELAARHAASEH